MEDTSARRAKKTIIIELCILFVLSLLPLFWLKPGEVVIGHDSGFRTNFLSYYKSLLYAWNPVMNLGIDWQLYKGFLMTQLPEFIFTVITGSWVVGQRMMMVFWFFVMQASMYVLARTVKPEKEHWVFRLGASIFYAFNFFILQAWFIVERAKFSLYAALPVAILLIYLVFEKKKPVLRYAVYFGLLYFFASGGGSPPLYGASLVTWVVTIAFFSFRRFRERKMQGLLFGLRVACTFGLVFLCINAYWIVPQIGLYISTYKAAVAERGGIEGLISWERTTSANSSLLNLLRLQGIPDWYDNPYHPFAKTFLHNSVLILASFIPALAIFIGTIVSFVKKVKLHSVLYLAFVLLGIGLLLSGGSHPPFGYFYEYAMRHVPGFAIFRSSFYKFGPLVWFSIIFLAFYFADSLLASIKKHKAVHVFVGVCLVAAVLVYHFPFFTADIFQFSQQFSTKIRIPSYVATVVSYANAKTDPHARILVLPELTESFFNVQVDSYTWKFFSLDIFPRNAINRSIIANDNGAPDDIFQLYTEFMDGTKTGFLTLARYMGIRYILWRDDVVYSQAAKQGRTISFQKERLAGFKLKPVFQAGAWQLYDLGSQVPVPLVWAPEDLLVTHQAVEHTQELLLTQNGNKTAVIEGTPLPEQVIEAACLYCELDVYPRMVRETPQPKLRFQPGTLFFSRLLMSDAAAIRSAVNPEAIFNAAMSHTQLQLALLASADKPKDYNEDAIMRDIEQTFTRAQKQLDQIDGRQKNVYTIRLLLYIDVSQRFMNRFPTLNTFFSTLRNEVSPLVWMTSDPTDVKYELETATDGVYAVLVTNVAALPSHIEIDGVSYADYRSIPIPAGYHKIRLVNPSTLHGFSPQIFLETVGVTHVATPEITFFKGNPTNYSVTVKGATSPFILILNEAFDSRWKVTLAGDRAPLTETHHGKANGLGNAWYIDRPGNYTLSITYQPQRLFLFGAIVTGISLGIGVLILIKRSRP